MLSWLRRLRKWLDEYIITNWQYKLAALAAAVVIWGYVAGQQTVEVVFSVPIRFQNVPAGSRVIDQKLNSAEVTLSGRRDHILTLSHRDVWVSLELSGLRNGRNLYLLSPRDVIAPPGVDIKDITPRQMNIQIAPGVPPAAERGADEQEIR